MKQAKTDMRVCFTRHLRAICFALFGFCISFRSMAQDDLRREIVVLFDNDVHCSVDGYAKIAGLRDELQKSCDVVIVSCGDFLSGASLGRCSHGRYIADIMSSVGYDFVTLGNHEFDFSVDTVLQYADKLGIICCNFLSKNESNPYCKGYAIKKFGDISVAFVGVTTPETITTSFPENFKNKRGHFIYSFCPKNYVEIVQNNVNLARQTGAEVVILLAHLGTTTSTNLVRETYGIDVVLDGHSHDSIPGMRIKNKLGQNTILSSTGSKFKSIGKLSISPQNTFSIELLPTNTIEYCNRQVFDTIQYYKNLYANIGGQIVGTSEISMPIYGINGDRLTYTQGCAIGQFCAKAITSRGGDIGVVNGGSIRASLPVGTITMEDLTTISPFFNDVYVVTMKGKDIVDMLEIGAHNVPLEYGGFLHTSGLSYEIDTSVFSPVLIGTDGVAKIKNGARRVSNVCVLGEPIVPRKRYSVALSTFMLEHGDGYNIRYQKVISNNGTMLDLLSKFIEDSLHGSISSEWNQYDYVNFKVMR